MASAPSFLMQPFSCCLGGEDGSLDEKEGLLALDTDPPKPSIRLVGPVHSTNPMVYPRNSDAILISVPPKRSKDEAVERIVTAIRLHSTGDKSLAQKIKGEVTLYGGWDEWLADSIFQKLCTLVEAGDKGSWGDAFAKAVAEAKKVADEMIDWVEDHPYITAAFVCVVVFGVLMLMCPWVLEILGFEELGPTLGSWAARWQSTYGGAVPKGSLFSYLQRLGMTRKKWGWI